MTVQQLPDYLKQHWLAIREQLLSGTYASGEAGGDPEAGRRSAKAWHSDGVGSVYRASGDQGSATQVGPGVFDHSYGFRPERSAHQAVDQAQQYIASGHRWVVDLDLEKFFDRVNHD